MEQVNEDAGYSNTTIAYTTLNPMGLFSERHTSVDEIPDGGEIAIPDDVSNESRALLLLQAAGLIELDAEKGLLPTVNDITSNPKNLKFTVLAANQTARAMTDVDASVVNNDMAADAGLVPTEDAIFLEPVADSSKPYYNVIAAREDESEDPDFQIIVDYYQTPEVEKIIDEVTNKSSIPVWE
jgi:D-methionine transport system substrate-binding protein